MRSTSARRVRHTMVIFLAQAGLAVLHRLHGRDDAAVEAATEALELYRAGGFRRFRNRIDPNADLQAAAAVCCEVLAAIAAERDEPERAATLLGQADRLRADAGVEVPAFQQRRRRPGPATRRSRPSARTPSRPPSNGAARERSGHADAPEPDVQRQRGTQVSALLDGASRPARRGPHSRRIP